MRLYKAELCHIITKLRHIQASHTKNSFFFYVYNKFKNYHNETIHLINIQSNFFKFMFQHQIQKLCIPILHVAYNFTE